jgi:hypothetical protein
MEEHDKSVMAEHDRTEESVIVEHDSENQSVIPHHDKSVIPPHERTKDTIDKSKLAAFDDSDDAQALVRLAYEAVCKIGPPMREGDGRSNLKVAMELIERHGYADCIRGVSTLRERNNAMVVGKNKRGITAPLPYLRSVMDAEAESLTVSNGFVENAWSQLNGTPDYMRDE